MTTQPTIFQLPPLPRWQRRAECGGMPTFDQQTEDEQRAYCRRCPVSEQCLAWALQNELGEEGVPYGMYGGVSPRGRQRLRRALRRSLRGSA